MKHTAPTFFDLENQFAKIYQINNFLPKLKQIIPWEIFRPTLEQIRNKERLSNAGRKPFDVILMFKIIVLQTVYKLSIEQTELQIRDRLSFRDFLDLAFSDTVPDAKTIWLFAEQLKKQGIEQQLFGSFNAELEERGFGINSGSFVAREQSPVRKQREKSEVLQRFAHPTKTASPKVLDTTYTQNKNVTVFYKLLQNNVILDDE